MPRPFPAPTVWADVDHAFRRLIHGVRFAAATWHLNRAARYLSRLTWPAPRWAV